MDAYSMRQEEGYGEVPVANNISNGRDAGSFF